MAPSRPGQAVLAALAAAAAGGLAAAGGYAALLRRPLPKTSGEVRVAGLHAPVEVVRDRWGIPHIYADDLHDLFLAQGYVHAQDRLWQLDFSRRLVAGRLAEVLGEVAVPLDRWMRTLSLRHVAEQEPALVDAEQLALLEAYAAGVNARIAEGRLPVEFTLLRFRPEPWTPVDSFSWVKMMAWTLSVNWETEILRAQLVDRLGPELAAELEPPYAAGRPFIVPEGVDYSCIGSTAVRRSHTAQDLAGPSAVDGIGSNNWAVSGRLTDTGKPLFANDMHLGLTVPAIWYENHLSAPDFEVTGVSFPGLPAVVSGHNGQVAWGYTNGFADVQDLYLERLRRTDDGRVEYEVEDGWAPAEVRRETITVKGGEPVEEEVVVTRHGPVINLLSDLAGEQPLALRWTALEPNAMLGVLFSITRATSCADMRERLRGWHTPVQNVVYADVHGSIGYTYAGRVPVRAKGDGRLPVPGWTGEYEWTGTVPYEDQPHLQDPESGVIVTANNRVVDEGYPYWLGNDFVSGNRADRIHQLITEAGVVDVPTIQRMHLDRVSLPARRFAAVLSQLETDDARLGAVLDRMRRWDGTLGPQSPEAAVYEVLLNALANRLLTPRLGPLTAHYLGKGLTPVLAEQSLLGERCREWLESILAQPDSHWFDLGGGERRDDQLLAALRETVDRLTERLGPDLDSWTWGQLHTLTLRHPLGAKRPLDRLFNRGPFPMGGDADTVWNSQIASHDPENTELPMIGPPFRFIADLGDLSRSLGQLLPGQSGQPTSPHYADNIAEWLAGEYHPLYTDRLRVLAAAEATLRLLPTP
jgi:penicillin amidase